MRPDEEDFQLPNSDYYLILNEKMLQLLEFILYQNLNILEMTTLNLDHEVRNAMESIIMDDGTDLLILTV